MCREQGEQIAGRGAEIAGATFAKRRAHFSSAGAGSRVRGAPPQITAATFAKARAPAPELGATSASARASCAKARAPAPKLGATSASATASSVKLGGLDGDRVRGAGRRGGVVGQRASCATKCGEPGSRPRTGQGRFGVSCRGHSRWRGRATGAPARSRVSCRGHSWRASRASAPRRCRRRFSVYADQGRGGDRDAASER